MNKCFVTNFDKLYLLALEHAGGYRDAHSEANSNVYGLNVSSTGYSLHDINIRSVSTGCVFLACIIN